MVKQFATYEIALKLKELGFDEECLAWYYLPANATNENDYILALDSETPENQVVYIKAPLWQQVIDWFREKHNLLISISRLNDNYVYGLFNIYRNCYVTSMTIGEIREIRTYNEAREQAILKAIELCQKI